jgi:hypothetical protein
MCAQSVAQRLVHASARMQRTQERANVRAECCSARRGDEAIEERSFEWHAAARVVHDDSVHCGVEMVYGGDGDARVGR